MSADSRTVCPECHPDLLVYRRREKCWGDPTIIDHAAEDLGYDRSVRENYEFFFKATPEGIVLVSEYSGNCRDCGFHFEVNHSDLVKPML